MKSPIMYDEIAKQLDSAALGASPMQQLSEQHEIDLDAAYHIQRLLVQHRVDRGNHLTGIKMGFTSLAKMEQMGVHDMIWGRLTSDMAIEKDGSLNLSSFIHPRAEPEIAFRIARDIDHELALDELGDYVDGIAAAIEVIDSRYKDFKFSLSDVVADNCSSSAYVLGDWQKPSRSIDALAMTMWFGDEKVAEGSSSAILGDPWKSLQAATRLASAYSEPLKAGYLVLAGAATTATLLQAGHRARVEVEMLGSTAFRVLP